MSFDIENSFSGEPNTFEYWENYYLRLINFVDYYKKGCDNHPTYEQINFNYDVEFYNEKVASLYAEINRVKVIMSVLRYKYETDEI